MPNDNIRPTETMEQTQEDPSNQQKIGSLGEAIVSSLKDRNPLNLAMGNSSTETENTSSRLMQIEITNLPSSIDQLSFSEINNFLLEAKHMASKLSKCEKQLCYATEADTKFRKMLNIALEISNIRGFSSTELALQLIDSIDSLSGETQKIGLLYSLRELGPMEAIRALEESSKNFDAYALAEFTSEVLNHENYDKNSDSLDRFVFKQSLEGGEINALVLLKQLHKLPHFSEEYVNQKQNFCQSLTKFPREVQKELESSLYVSLKLSGMSAKDMPHCRL